MRPLHTPGPWVVEAPMEHSATYKIVHLRRTIPHEEDVANCRLIAAAPELLAQLRYLVSLQASGTTDLIEILALLESLEGV